MKVLFVNHPDCKKYDGGDGVQLRKTAEAIGALGVEVDITFDPEPGAAGYDLAHVWNLRTTVPTVKQVQSLKRFGVPIVMTPFYCDMQFLFWVEKFYQCLSNPACTPDIEEKLIHDMRLRSCGFPMPNGELLSAHGPSEPIENYLESQRLILADVDYLIPNSHVEMDMLRKQLRTHLPFRIAPTCVDNSWAGGDALKFKEKYGLSDFVLQVSRIEYPKNQLFLCMAMKDLDMPLVLIGKPLDENYLAMCRKRGPKNLTVLPWMPEEDLRNAYAAARVHVLPSIVETCGMVSLEAALNDCNIVASLTGCELEYLQDNAYYCDPLDAQSIKNAVLKAWNNWVTDGPKRAKLREDIDVLYQWDAAAFTIKSVYEDLLCRL